MTERLTDEETRILLAASEARLFRNERGRYEIEDEIPPDRKTREDLMARGFLTMIYNNGHITETGHTAFADEMRKRVRSRKRRTSKRTIDPDQWMRFFDENKAWILANVRTTQDRSNP